MERLLNMFHYRSITIYLNSIETLDFLLHINTIVLHYASIFCAFRNFIFNRWSIFFETLDWHLSDLLEVWNTRIETYLFIFRRQRLVQRLLRKHQKCYQRVLEKHLVAFSRNIMIVFFSKMKSISCSVKTTFNYHLIHVIQKWAFLLFPKLISMNYDWNYKPISNLFNLYQKAFYR